MMTITAKPYLREIDNNYSLNDIQNKIECVLADEGYGYKKNGSSEIIIEGNKADIKKVIFNNILIPKMVLEAALSFYQCGDNVYIRTTLR